jgi:DNA polymerase III subunit alpha
MNYVGLHVHTHFSLFDGIATPEEYVNRAVELGMPAIAITDHGTLSGHRELHRIAKAKGIKPILGLEGYMCADISDTRDKSEREGQQDLV